MAKKFPSSSDKETSWSKPREETSRAESSRENNGESTHDQNSERDASTAQASGYGSHQVATYNVSDDSAAKVLQFAPFKGMTTRSRRPVMTSYTTRIQGSTDTADSLRPTSTPETRDAKAEIDEQLRLTSSTSQRTGESLLSVLEASHKMQATVRQLSAALESRLSVTTKAHEMAVPDETDMTNGGKSPNGDSTWKSPAVPSRAVASGVGSQRVSRPHRNQLDDLAGATTELRHHQEFQRNLAESASNVLRETLLELLSLQTKFKCALSSASYVASSSQTWIPFNLAQRVSRVYYYSRGYSEEVSSAPLEVSGYSVRLSVICETKRGDVVLSFKGQFCACSGNEKMTWPFRGELMLTIHHPTDATRNRVHRLQPSRRQEIIMPRLVDNAPMHLAGPISASVIEEDGLWAMGTLHLSIKILL